MTTIKSNTVIVTVKGKAVIAKIPRTLEGVQLALQNAERLFLDAQKVSIPTKFALLEIGLEEIAKAWGIALSFEKSLFDNDPNLIRTLFRFAHIEREKYNDALKKLIKSIENFYSENEPVSFMIPFDTNTFSNHKTKIDFLSKFIKYVRDIQLPIMRASADRVKLTREIFGKYLSKTSLSNLKKYDKVIDQILNVDDAQLNDIINIKEDALYLNVNGKMYMSPSSRSYETETLGNLLGILIAMVKNELSLLFMVLKKKSEVKITGKN